MEDVRPGIGRAHGTRAAPDLPWVLDGADDVMTQHVLALMPPNMHKALVEEWRPAYQAAHRWETNVSIVSR